MDYLPTVAARALRLQGTPGSDRSHGGGRRRRLVPGRVVICGLLGVVAALLSGGTAAAQAAPAVSQTRSAAAQTTPAAQTKTAPAAQAKPAAALTLSVEVTDRSGEAVGDAAVVVAGPVERSGTTGEDGRVAFRSMRAGTYRLRFEHEGFTTLEREVVLRAGQPATVSVALTPAPAPSPAPEIPEPAEEPPPAAPEHAAREVEPRLLSIPDFLDKHLIGGEPHRTTLLACAEGGTARLLQIRDPLRGQEHPDLDELLYIVAGAGVLRIGERDTKVGPGFFALVPRGVPHSISRQGRNPLIALSVLAGEPCGEDQ